MNLDDVLIKDYQVTNEELADHDAAEILRDHLLYLLIAILRYGMCQKMTNTRV
jgi:hypothetical protein